MGGFTGFISYVALLAAIAGIMSTADSALIGVSNTVSVDLFKDWLFKDKPERWTVIIGKVISFLMILISIGIATGIQKNAEKTGAANYGAYAVIQQGILWQAFPAYLLGLYTGVHKYSVLTGLIVGILADVIFIALSLTGNDPFTAIDPTLAGLEKSWFAFVAVLLNLLSIAIVQTYMSYATRNNIPVDSEVVSAIESQSEMQVHLPDYNKRFEGLLTIKKIRDIMANIDEPLTKYYGIPVYAGLLCAILPVFHWIGEIDSDLQDRLGNDAKSLMYNGKYSKIFAGFPEWALASVLWFGLGAILLVIASLQWTVDRTLKRKSKKTTKSNDNDNDRIENEALKTNDSMGEIIYTNGNNKEINGYNHENGTEMTSWANKEDEDLL